MGYYGFAPYVSVAKRKRAAEKEVKKLRKSGRTIEPVVITGRAIATTFWGKAWCNNLESYSDYDNRLPRGRTYARNGSVIDLKMTEGTVEALVSGSSIYKIEVNVSKVAESKWARIVEECSGKIDSLIELLQGRFSKGVMEIITDAKKGLFPHPKEIEFDCSCPDGAYMCKHVAAVLYGVGARLDAQPEQLFLLRQADHIELIAKAGTTSLGKFSEDPEDNILAGTDLSSLFGIDIEEGAPEKTLAKTKKPKATAAKGIKTPAKAKKLMAAAPKVIKTPTKAKKLKTATAKVIKAPAKKKAVTAKVGGKKITTKKLHKKVM